VGSSIAVSSARAVSSGIAAVSLTVSADFVNGATNGTWSISCRLPEPQRISGARPPSTSSGEPFCCAPAIALIPFVTPGPAVRAHTPTLRVALAHPSAAHVADCSWRVSTTSIPSSLQPSKIENRWPPDRVNSLVTPRDDSVRATRRPPWTARPDPSVAWSAACSGAFAMT
jgi:hypothetical protein